MDPHLRTAGAGRGEDTILFLHGFPLDGSLWDAQMAALPAGWRGLAPDLRGFGRTPLAAAELPTGAEYPGVAGPDEAVLTMDGLAADAARLVEAHAGGAAVVCGLSMGGYVAFALRRQRPDLVRALVLADTRAAGDDEEGRENRRRMAETARTAGVEPIARAMVPKLLAPATLRDRPEVVDRVRAMIQATSPRAIIAAVAGMAERQDSAPELPEIRVPTLVLAGADDEITPLAGARAMARAIPDARMVEVPGAGHLAPLEQPTAVNDALREFLTAL